MASSLPSTSPSLLPLSASKPSLNDPLNAYSFSFFPSPPWTYGDDPKTGTGAYFDSLLSSSRFFPSALREREREREESYGPERPPVDDATVSGSRGRDGERGKGKAVDEEDKVDDKEEPEDDWFTARLSRSPTTTRRPSKRYSSDRDRDRDREKDDKRSERRMSDSSRSTSRPAGAGAAAVLYKPTGDERATKERDGRRREYEDTSRGGGRRRGSHLWREEIERDESNWRERDGGVDGRGREKRRSLSPRRQGGRRSSPMPPPRRSPSPPPPRRRPSLPSHDEPMWAPRPGSPSRHGPEPRWANLPPSPPRATQESRAPLPLFTSRNLRLPLVSLQQSLLFSDYSPYLLSSTPIDPACSTAYHWTLMRFLSSLAPREKWSTRPDAPSFSAPSFSSLVETVQEMQPDVQYIRRTFPLRRVEPPASLAAGRDLLKWEAMLGVLRWIWGDVRVGYQNVAWAIQELPRPLVALLRQLADISRYSVAVFFAWRECTTYLTQPSSAFANSRFTPRERRGRILLQWLNGGGDARKVFFFCDADGRPVPPEKRAGRGGEMEEVWDWWFERLGEERTVRELDEWEKRERYRRTRGA